MRGRLVTLELPPLPPARTEAAARYALEDQLADAPDDSHVALAAFDRYFETDTLKAPALVERLRSVAGRTK